MQSAYFSLMSMQVNSERWAVAYRSGMTSPPYELDLTVDNDSDWVDDLTQEEEDSAGEDSVSVRLFICYAVIYKDIMRLFT